MFRTSRTRRFLTTTAAALLLTLAGGGLAAPANGAAAPNAAHAVLAPAFNASGEWYVYQSNATVRVNFRQDANGNLFGSVSSGNTVGTLREGNVNGNDIYFIVEWNHGPVGRYTGVRGPDRRLSGTTFDLNNPSSQATWRTERTF